jgi:protein-S-isoprenylcysteine O-methyltransferase Ste14
MKIIELFKEYKPPKKIRALFIFHYSPLLLMILTGPITAIYQIWELPVPLVFSLIIGLIITIVGIIIYFKWEIFWEKTYKGQLVTEGIFKKIRHPHYTSLLILGFGLAFFFYSILALIIAFVAIPIMIISIYDEEKLLIQQYGNDYKNYMKEVPWRIIPRVF